MNHSHHALVVYVPSTQLFTTSVVGQFAEATDQYFQRLGINDVRELVTKAHIRPVAAEQKTLIIRADFITHEAQNALLKVFEEPPASTQFLLVLPVGCILLDTVLSRVQIVSLNDESKEQSKEFLTFLQASLAERIQMIDTAAKKKDSQWQQAIKNGLLTHIKQSKTPATKPVEFVARKLRTRGAANKMLLEHLALQLPARENT